MLISNNLPRIFLYNNNGHETRLPDPQASMLPDEVRQFYANTYPLLTTAGIEGPEIVNDELQYEFTVKMGTKG